MSKKPKEKYHDQLGINAKILVMSQLSDAQIEKFNDIKMIDARLEFSKFIISRLNGDLNHHVNSDLLYEDFIKEYPRFKVVVHNY